MDIKKDLPREHILESGRYVTISLMVGIFLMVIITVVLIASWL